METLLELSSKNGVFADGNNSTFTTVFGEPIRVAAGSTINFTNAFIDLGLQSADLISIPTNIQLGINFYRYDEDIPKVPKTQGTDPDPYSKYTMYFEKQALGQSNEIENINPPRTTFGNRTAAHLGTCLPAFLFQRTQRTRVAAGQVHETFEANEETATINIPAGFYSRAKFLQLVNDGFNLIGGSLTNADKPLENKVGAAAPYTVSPYDYQLAPNNNSNLLKAYEYSYASWDVIADDPDQAGGYPIKTHINDKTWNYWFFPVYTQPSNPNLFVDEPYPAYVWMSNGQTGFLAGTTKFNLNYDQENQIFFIDYAHSPILDSEQREIVQFSRQKTEYVDSNVNYRVETTGYKANGRAGGIMISRLFSLELDDNFQPVSQTNSGFWQKYLGFGFDDDFRTQFNADFITEVRTFGTGLTTSPDYLVWTQTLQYPDPKYFDTCTTNALIPIAWLQQQNWTDPDNDRGFSIVVNDIPKTFQSIGSRNILGTGTGQFVEPASHFLIELNIHNVRNDNYRDKDSYRQISAVAGKTYPSTASYIQSFADAAVQTLVMDEDTWIDRIEVRILNPDKTPATELGANSTVFIKLTQPVVVNSPQQPQNK